MKTSARPRTYQDDLAKPITLPVGGALGPLSPDAEDRYLDQVI